MQGFIFINNSICIDVSELKYNNLINLRLEIVFVKISFFYAKK